MAASFSYNGNISTITSWNCSSDSSLSGLRLGSSRFSQALTKVALLINFDVPSVRGS